MPRKTRPKSGYRLAPSDEAHLVKVNPDEKDEGLYEGLYEGQDEGQDEDQRRHREWNTHDLTKAQLDAIVLAAWGDAASWNSEAPYLLTAAAPQKINDLIKQFRIDRANEQVAPRPQEVAATLEQVAKVQASMVRALDLLRGDVMAFSLVAGAAESQGTINADGTTAKAGQLDIVHLRAQIDRLGVWIEAARGQAPRAGRGPSPSWALRQLIAGLADIWKTTGKRKLTRSYKTQAVGSVAFVRAVVGIADPKVTAPEIDTAMKVVLGKRGE